MNDVHPMPLRRVMPHSLEAERAVIGGVLLAARTIADVSEFIRPGDFYHPAHSAIFQAMADLDAASKPIDMITVAERMTASDSHHRLRGVGGEAYFGELATAVVTIENIAHYAKIVRDRAHRRRVIEAAQELAAAGYGGEDEDEFQARADATALEFLRRQEAGGPQHVRNALDGTIDVLEARYNAKSEITGVPSGWGALDAFTAGWQANALAIVAARPAMGKSAFVMGALGHAAMHGVPSLLFSLEMGKEELVERMIAGEGPVEASSLRVGKLAQIDWVKITKATGRIAEAALWIDDSPTLTLSDIRARARRWRTDSRAGGSASKAIVAVDYLQLVTGVRSREGNREREIAEISRGLKALAKELHCPVLALSQLSRKCEERADKRPQLSDLRESGAIEQDADLVAFLYRDEVYNAPVKPSDRLTYDEWGTAEVIIGKHRSGPTGKVKLTWRPEFTRFETVEP